MGCGEIWAKNGGRRCGWYGLKMQSAATDGMG